MPHIFARYHGIYMTNYLRVGKEDVLNKKRIVLSIDCEGYIHPTHIYVKFNPNILSGISYVGLLRPI